MRVSYLERYPHASLIHEIRNPQQPYQWRLEELRREEGMIGVGKQVTGTQGMIGGAPSVYDCP